MKSDREKIIHITTSFYDDALILLGVEGGVEIKLGADGMKISVVSRRRGFKLADNRSDLPTST